MSVVVYVSQYRHQHDDEGKNVIPRDHKHHPFRQGLGLGEGMSPSSPGKHIILSRWLQYGWKMYLETVPVGAGAIFALHRYRGYGKIPMLSYPIRQRKGGVKMDILLSLFVAVMGGVICHYIIKWLDGNNDDN